MWNTLDILNRSERRKANDYFVDDVGNWLKSVLIQRTDATYTK